MIIITRPNTATLTIYPRQVLEGEANVPLTINGKRVGEVQAGTIADITELYTGIQVKLTDDDGVIGLDLDLSQGIRLKNHEDPETNRVTNNAVMEFDIDSTSLTSGKNIYTMEIIFTHNDGQIEKSNPITIEVQNGSN